MLSAAATAVSLILLFVLVEPAPRTVTRASSVTAFVQSDQVAQQPYDWTISFCVAGIGSNPPVHLVLAPGGRLIAAYTSGSTGRFIPLPQAYLVSGWATVPCDTSDVFAPRINRAR